MYWHSVRRALTRRMSGRSVTLEIAVFAPNSPSDRALRPPKVPRQPPPAPVQAELRCFASTMRQLARYSVAATRGAGSGCSRSCRRVRARAVIRRGATGSSTLGAPALRQAAVEAGRDDRDPHLVTEGVVQLNRTTPAAGPAEPWHPVTSRVEATTPVMTHLGTPRVIRVLLCCAWPERPVVWAMAQVLFTSVNNAHAVL